MTCASMGGPEGTTIRVPLSFLGDGEYKASLVRDDRDDSAAVRIERTKVRRDNTITVQLRDSGGLWGR